jgi:hypothetical protein
MPISRINTNSIANNTIQGADLLDASITAAKIISVANTQITGTLSVANTSITGNIISSQITSVANTQLTGLIQAAQIGSANATLITSGTLPLAQGGSGTTTGQAIVPLQVVALSGLSQFGFSVAAYPQYVVYLNNLGGSTSGAIVRFRGSVNGGSSFTTNWNYRMTLEEVSGANTNYNANVGTASGGYIWYDIWNGAAPSGTNGVVTIAGTSYYATNKRLTFTSVMGGQTPSSQGLQTGMGQTQDDSGLYNYALFELSSGTFYGASSALICGVKAI